MYEHYWTCDIFHHISWDFCPETTLFICFPVVFTWHLSGAACQVKPGKLHVCHVCQKRLSLRALAQDQIEKRIMLCAVYLHNLVSMFAFSEVHSFPWIPQSSSSFKHSYVPASQKNSKDTARFDAWSQVQSAGSGLPPQPNRSSR